MMTARNNARGRKTVVDMNLQIQTFIDYKNELLDENGEIKSSAEKIYKTLSSLLQMDKRGIRQNIIRYASAIFGSHNIQKKSAKQKSVKEETWTTVDIDEEALPYFIIVRTQDKYRMRESLPNGWTDQVFRF